LKFSELQLENSLNQAIEKLSWQDCTPIQNLAIPVLLEGKDVSGLAQTGTGKTAAFLVPIMERILRARASADGLSEEQKKLKTEREFLDWKAQNFVLILVPTRELAEQVYENVIALSEFSGLRGVAVYGGTGYDKQKEAFKNSVEFVVATPGRLIDLYKEHFVDLKQVRAVVFDEADRMFDMGFKDDMKYILQRIPQTRQFLVFSATLNFDVLNTAYQFGADPFEIDISRDQAKADNVKDEIFHVGNDDKPQYLISLIKKNNPHQAIVFSNFKMNVERIASYLTQNGVPAMAISSLLSQSQRNRVLELFKAENEKNILVATDVAARGLDIKGVDLVINYDLPNDAESYVHRIGRTGRAGTEGVAFSLVGDKDVESLKRIEEYLKNKLPVGWLDDSSLIQDLKPMSYSDSFAPRNDRHHRGDERSAGRGPSRGGRDGGREGGRDGGRDNRDRGGYKSQRSAGGDGRNFKDRKPYNNNNNNNTNQQNRNTKPVENVNSTEGANGSKPNNHGPRPVQARGPNDRNSFRRNNNRPDFKGERSQELNGPRPERRPSSRIERSKAGLQKHSKSKSSLSKPGSQKSVVEKVSGFFKKLFGD
jgi:superfamily II DNA/RNA helicase